MNNKFSEPDYIVRDPYQLMNESHRPVYRYITFKKLTNLLKRKLFLTRMTNFADKFEGQLPVIEKRRMDKDRKWSQLFRLIDKACYVSCWTHDSYQAVDKWKEYCVDEPGVMIQSSEFALQHRIHKLDPYAIYCSKVKYIDFASEKYHENWHIQTNPHTPFIHKDKDLSFENEFRIIKLVYEDVNYWSKRYELDLWLCLKCCNKEGGWDFCVCPVQDRAIDWSVDPCEIQIKSEFPRWRRYRSKRDCNGIIFDLDDLDFIDKFIVNPSAPEDYFDKVRKAISKSGNKNVILEYQKRQSTINPTRSGKRSYFSS